MKYKKLVYILCTVVLVGLIVFRIYMINSESSRQVFNPMRAQLENGATVAKLSVEKKTGILQEPLFIKNNTAFVSSTRINKFKVGQRVDHGKIVSVSNQIDLDSGLFRIKTSGVGDGAHFAELKYTGFFVPAFAIKENNLMVIENGIAQKRSVKITDQDSENAVVSYGLSDNDIIILSQIEDGEKVR
jgi:hypothetical protein